mgnify:CR=1 FL=1
MQVLKEKVEINVVLFSCYDKQHNVSGCRTFSKSCMILVFDCCVVIVLLITIATNAALPQLPLGSNPIYSVSCYSHIYAAGFFTPENYKKYLAYLHSNRIRLFNVSAAPSMLSKRDLSSKSARSSPRAAKQSPQQSAPRSAAQLTQERYMHSADWN